MSLKDIFNIDEDNVLNSVFNFNTNFNWISFITILIGLILSLILANELCVLTWIYPITIIGDMLLLVIVLAIGRMTVKDYSLKVYIPLMVLFSILTFIMLFLGIVTGDLYGFKSIFNILNLIVPIILFIYFLFKGDDFVYMGISLIIINCVANLLKVLPIGANIWETALYYSILGFVVVWLFAIPMIIIKIIQKDPTKNKHFANLFNTKTSYDDFINSKFYILKYYDNERNRSLIVSATYFFKLNNNLSDIEFNKSEFLSFKDEIQNLSNEIQNALIKGKNPILNLDKFNESKINLLDLINKIEHKESSVTDNDTYFEELHFLKDLIYQYDYLFSYFVDGLFCENPQYLTVKFNKRELSLKSRIKNSINLKNNTFRTAIRYLFCIGVIFVLFILLKGSSLAISLSTGLTIILFTLKDTVDDTFKKNMHRLAGSFGGMIVAIILLILLTMFNSLSLLILLTFLALLLYFAYKESNYVLGLACLMIFLLFINLDKFALSLLKRFLTVIFAVIIISVISSRVLPNYRPANIVSLMNSKLKFIMSLEEHSCDLIEIDKFEIDFKDNNKDIDYLLNQFKEHIKDEEIINKFINLNDLLDNCYGNLDDLIVSMNYNKLNSKTYCNIHSEIINSFSNIINGLEADEIQLNLLNEEFNKLASPLNKEDFSSINYLNECVIKDLDLINDLITEMNSKNLFKTFNDEFRVRDYKKLF
ncbi:MAG: FUSC family protein [Methanobacteriaceae archaeon]|nr:FUSC family protein [Methanobacteriaceae archaeon]